MHISICIVLAWGNPELMQYISNGPYGPFIDLTTDPSKIASNQFSLSIYFANTLFKIYPPRDVHMDHTDHSVLQAIDVDANRQP